MNNSMKDFFREIRFFADEETGAQVVEYALIIAVISIALVIGLQSLGGGSFATFIARLTTCLTGTTCA